MFLELILLVALHGNQGIYLAFQAADGEEQFFVVGGGHGLHRRNDECEEGDLFRCWLGLGHSHCPSSADSRADSSLIALVNRATMFPYGIA